MPGNRFPFTVRVGSQIDLVSFFRFLTKLRQNLSLAADSDILGFIAVLRVKAKLAFGKIADMSLRSQYLVV